VDPYLIWPFVGTAVAGIVSAVLFWFLYRKLDHDEFMSALNQEAYANKAVVNGDSTHEESQAGSIANEKRDIVDEKTSSV
jgi:hypothetical protein